MHLDPIDKQILADLQKDGRAPNAQLAKEHKLAASSMLSRVRRLEEKGIISGYRAILDPKALGYNLQAIVMVNLDQHRVQSIEPFEEHVRAIPEVKAGYHVTGRYDYILFLVLRDIDHLGELVKKTLSVIPGLQRQETFLIFSSLKDDRGYSLDYIEES